MNLINCNENCIYQSEGSCKMGPSASINAVRVNGCSYYRKKVAKESDKKVKGTVKQ